jgi:hypothetical protein
MEDQLTWFELPYAGEQIPPNNPVDPLAGSWPTFYIQNDGEGNFKDLNGNIIQWNVIDPSIVDYDEQLKIVKRILRKITRRQIEITKYWGTGVATKQWTPIIDRLIDAYDVDPARAARIVAATQAGINDTFVVTWYFKYLYQKPRPGQLDPKLAAILCTPRFPSFVSGHSSMSGCAERILSYFFPGKAKRLTKLAEEDALARVLSGTQFPVDILQGLKLGRQIGDLVVDVLKNQLAADLLPIDTPFTKNIPVKLLPPPYRQVIPFNYNGRETNICGCTSKVSRKTKKLCVRGKMRKPCRCLKKAPLNK